MTRDLTNCRYTHIRKERSHKMERELGDMSIFDFLTMLGGLCLFLFGMNLMGQALERRAGGSLRTLLG